MAALILTVLFLIILGGIGFVLFRIVKTQQKKIENNEEEGEYPSTQDQLPFDYIRRRVVKLKSGVYIMILKVPSINTHLMEGEEREIIREIYASILNSLKSNIQFYKQSRLVDVREYVARLERLEISEGSSKKAEGIFMYRNFIADLVRENSLQTKNDYVVVPYRIENKRSKRDDPNSLKKYSVSGEGRDVEESNNENERFERAYRSLHQLASSIEKQIRRLGINPYILGDDELFELFYTTYNKDRSINQSMRGVNPNDYTTMYVRREE